MTSGAMPLSCTRTTASSPWAVALIQIVRPYFVFLAAFSMSLRRPVADESGQPPDGSAHQAKVAEEAVVDAVTLVRGLELPRRFSTWVTRARLSSSMSIVR